MAQPNRRDSDRLREFRVTVRRFRRYYRLVDRAEAAGLAERVPDENDGRVVRVRLTGTGDRIVPQLARAHLDRQHELAAVLDELVNRYDRAGPVHRTIEGVPWQAPGRNRT